MSSRGNQCNKSDAKKGVGRKKAIGLDSIALLQSNNDNATRELHRSSQFLDKTIREQLSTHETSIKDAFILAMAGKESIFHTFADDNSGSTISPWKVKSSSFFPDTKIPYHDIRDLSMARDEHFYRDAFMDGIVRAFREEWGGTQDDPHPGAKAICYHPAPSSTPGIGLHNDSGRIKSFMRRTCIEICEDSGELTIAAFDAATTGNGGGSNDEDGTDEDKYTHGFIKSKPQQQLAKVVFPRPEGLSQYGMSQYTNGSGPVADHGDGTGVITHHAFHFKERNHQRLLAVIDLRYTSLARHDAAAEKAKTTPFSIYKFLSSETKARIDADIADVVGRAHSDTSKNRRLLEHIFESVGSIRPTVADDQSLSMCACGQVAITHGPEDDRVNGKYVLQRCNECRKEDDLAHPCNGKCGRDSRTPKYQYCLDCYEYKCSSKSCDNQRLTFENSYPGAALCIECQKVAATAHNKRKRAEETSAAVASGRKKSKSGRLTGRPFDHREIKLVVQAVCENRSSPTSQISWAAVTEKLQGRDDFPSTATQQDVKNAWKNKTGKPMSVAAYENSPNATANKEKGDWITGVCSGCDNKQSMFVSQLAKRQLCRDGCKLRIKFTRKDETVDSTEGEGNE